MIKNRWYEATLVKPYLGLPVGHKLFAKKHVTENLVCLWFGNFGFFYDKEVVRAHVSLGPVPQVAPESAHIEAKFNWCVNS